MNLPSFRQKDYFWRSRPPKIPTDLEIFNAIYSSHYAEFAEWGSDSDGRQNKNYVPIDIDAIARRMNVDGDIIFCRLYYLHRQKYGYSEAESNGKLTRVPFFDKKIGKDTHAIHFPIMVSVFADLRKEEERDKATVRLALSAIAISIISVLISTIVLF